MPKADALYDGGERTLYEKNGISEEMDENRRL